MIGVEGISSVAVKCVDIRKNTGGEGALLDHYWHSEAKARVAKGIRYPCSPSRKRWILNIACIDPRGVIANALSIPPGEYARKGETQRNWRGPAQAVEHVV